VHPPFRVEILDHAPVCALGGRAAHTGSPGPKGVHALPLPPHKGGEPILALVPQEVDRVARSKGWTLSVSLRNGRVSSFKRLLGGGPANSTRICVTTRKRYGSVSFGSAVNEAVPSAHRPA
jgi:hypothetical protein